MGIWVSDCLVTALKFPGGTRHPACRLALIKVPDAYRARWSASNWTCSLSLADATVMSWNNCARWGKASYRHSTPISAHGKSFAFPCLNSFCFCLFFLCSAFVCPSSFPVYSFFDCLSSFSCMFLLVLHLFVFLFLFLFLLCLFCALFSPVSCRNFRVLARVCHRSRLSNCWRCHGYPNKCLVGQKLSPKSSSLSAPSHVSDPIIVTIKSRQI
jgi:hypothetical protein